MRENRVIEQNRCCHLIRRRAHRAFVLTDEGQVRAVALMRRVEAGVQAGMSYCINRTVSISSFEPPSFTCFPSKAPDRLSEQDIKQMETIFNRLYEKCKNKWPRKSL